MREENKLWQLILILTTLKKIYEIATYDRISDKETTPFYHRLRDVKCKDN